MENIKQRHDAKSLNTALLTWQISFQKSRSFLIVFSESHRILVKSSGIFFGCIRGLPFIFRDLAALVLQSANRQFYRKA